MFMTLKCVAVFQFITEQKKHLSNDQSQNMNLSLSQHCFHSSDFGLWWEMPQDVHRFLKRLESFVFLGRKNIICIHFQLEHVGKWRCFMQLLWDHWSRGFMRFLIGILSEKRKAMQNQCLPGKVIFNFILPKNLASDLLYIWLVVSTQVETY